MKREAGVRALTFVILLTVVQGCTEKEQEGRAFLGEGPARGGTFRVAQLTPETLDPMFIDDVYESFVVNQIFEGLLTFDVNLMPVPAIARDWTLSPDRLTYTFTLRRGVTFHNGREVTAEDVVYSFTRIFDPGLQVPSIARQYLDVIKGTHEYALGKTNEITGLKALETHTLEITLSTPSVHLLTVLAMDNTKVVPKEEVEKKGIEWFDEHPVGTGPFKFASWQKNERIILVAYEGYFGKRPYLDSLIVHVPFEYDENEWGKAFLEGRIETVAVPVGQLETFTGRKMYTIVKRPELSCECIGFNVHLPPLTDVRVRQAISHALDRKRLVELDPESFVLSSGILPPGMPGYSPAEKVPPYDPEKAKELLREAGVPEGRRLGRLEYWGVGTYGASPYENDTIVKEDLAEVGIDVEVKYESWLEFDGRVCDGRAQMFSMSFIADIPDPASFLFSLFHSTSSANFFHYHSAAIDSALERAKEEQNYFERLRICRDAEKRILEDAPLVPLDHVVNIVAFQPYVRGIELSPYGIADMAMEKIWITTEPTSPTAGSQDRHGLIQCLESG